MLIGSFVFQKKKERKQMWDKIIEAIDKGNSFLNDIVWGWPAIVMILGTGLLLSIMTRFLQVRYFGASLKATIIPTLKGIGKKQKNTDKNTVSPFEAFSAAISGTVGTGNIIGVTSAILTGGPGAVFWMWVSAFFGMVTNYSENVLGLYYRKRNKDGSFSGGAFHYLDRGLHLKWLGYIAAVFCLIAAIGMSGVQTNKIVDTISSVAGNDNIAFKLVLGAVVATFVALIIVGGIKRIGKVTSMLVPFMSLLFIVLALILIIINVKEVPGAFAKIFKTAFNFKAAGGGIMGYAFATVIRKGMARGVFSNEAGLGSSVIAHSASVTKEPVIQGLWGVFEVFFDTFVICTFTALAVLTSPLFAGFTGLENDTATSIAVFANTFGGFGKGCFAVILPLFAFTTIIAWSYYGEKATEFCFQKLGEKGQKAAVLGFKIVYVVLIVASALIESELIWGISDTANGLMALPNLIAVVLLSGVVVKITKNYFARQRGEDVEPMLSDYPELNEEFKEEIKNK